MTDPHSEPRAKRVLITVFDALKPEFITPELMPNLHAFSARGFFCANSHSTFLTETRVNQSAVTSGCMSQKHGLVANLFVAPDISPDRVLNTGDDIQLEAAFKRASGKLIGVPTLGQMLAKAGRSYATLSAGTPGGGRLINHSAETDGTFRYAMRRPEASCPAGVDKTIETKFGPLPKYQLPAKDWIARAVDVYLDYVEPEVSPDVMLLWLCEPDESFHYLGIGTEGSLATIRHVDAEFGRILSHHEAEIERGDLAVVAMSDHGQIEVKDQPINVSDKMRMAGFATGEIFDGETDFIFAGSNAGGIWVRDRDTELTEQLAKWLLGEEWCGPMFTKEGVLGTLQLSLVFADHPRAPDIALIMKTENGISVHDSPYPDGGGSHGGLSRAELHNFIALNGGAFKSGVVSDLPAGNIDVTPTVLELLGLPQATHFDGRILGEAFADGPSPQTVSSATSVKQSTNTTGPRTHLKVSNVGSTHYLDQAWTEA